MKVVVLGGGNSPEREVALRSAKAVAAAARRAGFEVIEVDAADGLDFLGSLPRNTIILPMVHGIGGEDGTIQKELENRELAFLGSDSSSSKKCLDKWLTRQVLVKSNLPMPEGYLVTASTYGRHPMSNKPHVLIVRLGGSSIGTLIVRDPQKVVDAQVKELFKMEGQAIIEELIEGVEATVAILDQKALPVIEIRLPEGLEFDYENKYNGATSEICPPESISLQQQKMLKTLAEKVHKKMGCRHLSRVDIMIDSQGQPFVLEINNLPGMTDQSLYPKSAAEAGISMPDLVKRFVEMVKRDYRIP